MDMHREFYIPFTGPYYVPPNGTRNGFGTDFPWSKGFARIVRNPYYFAVDPDGNQLPYIDSVNYQQVESRETAAFRAMAGEVDGPDGRMARLKELPLYHYNMEKGDYSVYRGLNSSGLDSGFVLSMDYKLDPEVGKLLRTRDFRFAWSYAIDREAINDAIFLGLGVPQNWVPHPGTLFAPGAEWANYEIRYDLPKAKELMANMGYQDKNGDGYLDRLDGKGNVELFLEAGASVGLGNIFAGSEHIEVAILVQKYLKDLGIKLNYRLGADAGGRKYAEGRQYLYLGNDHYSAEPWGPPWTPLIPQYEGRSMGPQVATYFFSGGKEGMKPSGPDPNWSDIYGKMSPPGESYPSDISGNMKVLQELIVEGRGLQRFSPRRIEIGKEIFRIHSREKYVINTVSYSGCCGRVGMVRNNLRNFDLLIGVGYSQTLFFEDGIDNMNNPGNRSTKHKSWSFALNL
jgi:ABC-type transport system substrate-binding protein